MSPEINHKMANYVDSWQTKLIKVKVRQVTTDI